MIGPSSKAMILYSPKITDSNAIDLIGSHARELEKKIREVVYYLRNVIHRTKKRPLPENLKLDGVFNISIVILLWGHACKEGKGRLKGRKGESKC